MIRYPNGKIGLVGDIAGGALLGGLSARFIGGSALSNIGWTASMGAFYHLFSDDLKFGKGALLSVLLETTSSAVVYAAVKRHDESALSFPKNSWAEKAAASPDHKSKTR